MVSSRPPAPQTTALAVVHPARRADRRFLLQAEAKLRARCRRAAGDLIECGRILLAVRRCIGHGRLGPWVDSIGMSRRTARQLVAVARVFGDVPAEPLSRIDATALYALVRPDCPGPLREYVVERATDGERVTARDVNHYIASYRDTGTAPLRLAQAVDPPRPNTHADAAHAGDNWLLLVAALSPGVTLHFAHVVDAESGDPMITVTRLAPGERPRYITRSKLEAAILGLTGEERTRVCRTCLEPKSLDEFSLRKDLPDGRNWYCLACERERVKEATKRK